MIQEMDVTNFNLRVYGILIHDNAVLITDEHRGGVPMTKFPGGGLEKGEGLAACLIREFKEELNIEIEVANFFYVNDFLQLSRFNPADQLISFYYCVTTDELENIDTVIEERVLSDGEQAFRWVNIEELSVDCFTFPIDRVVCTMLQSQTNK